MQYLDLDTSNLREIIGRAGVSDLLSVMNREEPKEDVVKRVKASERSRGIEYAIRDMALCA